MNQPEHDHSAYHGHDETDASYQSGDHAAAPGNHGVSTSVAIMATDPVCKMNVEPGNAATKTEYDQFIDAAQLTLEKSNA